MKQSLLFVLLCSLITAVDLPAADTVWLGFPMSDGSPQIASAKITEDKSFGSAFLKQLRRQALLIAARDGLGTSTRDAFLSETATDGAVQVAEPDRFFVDQFEGRNFFAQNVDYPAYVTELEKLSRTDFVTALEKVGVTRFSLPKDDESADFEEIEKLLADYAFIPHVEAIRQLHAAIRNQGETPPLLTALVKGYTQLQILTNSSVRDTHRVFQARAILYAQRAAALFGENPETLSLRAAAWSLNNFHRISRQEFAAIPVSENESAWIRLARLYADFDFDGLDKEIESLQDQPEQPLGKLLKFCLLTYSENRDSLAIPYGRSVIADLPDCSRIYLNLFGEDRSDLILSPDGKLFCQHLAKQLVPQLRNLKSQPQTVSTAAHGLRTFFSSEKEGQGHLPGLFGGGRWTQTEFRSEGFYVALAELLQAMNEATPEQDRGEPSLQTLATLIQDETFHAVLNFAIPRTAPGGMGGRDATILTARPVIDTHPGMNQLGAACQNAKLKAEFKERLQENPVPYELISQLNDVPGYNRVTHQTSIDPQCVAHRFADPENVRDQVLYREKVRRRAVKEAPAFSVDALEKLCPNNPLTVMERLTRQRSYDEAETDALSKRFGTFPNVRDAIVDRFLQNDRADKAIALLRQAHKARPERNFTLRTAKFCLQHGTFGEAVEVLKEFVAVAKGGRNRAEANWNIGQILCTAGKLEEAKPFLDALFEDAPIDAKVFRSRWLELTGKFDAAEAAYRDNRDDAYIRWCMACFRMSHKMLDNAIDFAYDKIMEQKEQAPGGRYHQFYRLYFIFQCTDIPMEEEFGKAPSVRVFFDYNNSKAGFQAFFEALEAGDRVKSNALLKFLRMRGHQVGKEDLAHLLKDTGIEPNPRLNPIAPQPILRLLAGMFELDQRSEEPGKLAPEEVEELLQLGYTNVLALADFSEMLYLLGRYYTFYGQREKGLDYYRRLFALRNLWETYDECFAVRDLNMMGVGRNEIPTWRQTDPGLPKHPASQDERERFAHRLNVQLEPPPNRPNIRTQRQ